MIRWPAVALVAWIATVWPPAWAVLIALLLASSMALVAAYEHHKENAA